MSGWIGKRLREVIRKWQNLEATIDLYTANDIEANFDEAEYKEKLKAIEETYKEVNASIKDFLQDYEEKEFWKNKIKKFLTWWNPIKDNLDLP